MSEDEARELLRRVIRRIAPEADVDSLPPQADFRRELDLDSMDFLEVVSGLCKGAGISIPERDYPKIATLESCTAYIAGHTAAAARST